MKKLFLLLAAVMLTLSASATTVYWDNSEVGWDSFDAYVWTDGNNATINGTAVTIDGHALYQFDTDKKNIIFRKNKAWSNPQTEDLEVAEGYVYGKANIKSGTADPIAIIVNGKWTPYNTTGTNYSSWYVNLGCSVIPQYWEGVHPSKEGSITFQQYAIGTNTFKIKVWNGKADTFYGTGEVSVGENTLPIAASENACGMTIKGAASGDSYIISFDIPTAKLTVTKVGGDVPTPPTPGDFTGWYFNIGTADIEEYWKGVAVNADGTAENTDIPVGTNVFKVKTYDGSKDAYYTTASKTIETGVPTQLTASTENDCAMTITDAAADDKFNFAYDCNTNTLTVTKVGGDVPTPPTDMPETLYIIGNIPNCQYGMNPTIGVQLVKDGNEFKGETIILDAYEGFGWFSFCQALGDPGMEESEAWGIVNSYDRFGPATETLVTPNEKFDFETYKEGVNASSCGSYKIAANDPGKTYIFLLNFETKKLTVTVGSGVGIIDNELEGKPVYFNLQGQRVENPTNGIYVRVLNGKATKVMK